MSDDHMEPTPPPRPGQAIESGAVGAESSSAADLAWEQLNTLRGFMRDRMTWLKVVAVDNPDRGGWDVMLRIDGTYSADGSDKAAMVEFFTAWLRRVIVNEFE